MKWNQTALRLTKVGLILVTTLIGVSITGGVAFGQDFEPYLTQPPTTDANEPKANEVRQSQRIRLSSKANASNTEVLRCDDAKDEGAWLLVLPSEPPPTRTRMSFDSFDGHHAEIEWNPFESARLGKMVYLHACDWQVSLGADALRFAETPDINLAWRRFELGKPDSDDALIGQAYVGMSRVQAKESELEKLRDAKTTTDEVEAIEDALKRARAYDRAVTFHIQVLKENPSLTHVRESLGKSEGGQTGGLAFPGRSIDTSLHQATNDLLQVLGEIVIERARSGALDIMHRQLNEFLCGDSLIWKNGDKSNLIFPNTCALFQYMRFEELLSSGRILLTHLAQDAFALSMHQLEDNLDEHFIPLMALLVQASIEHLIQGEDAVSVDPSLILVALSQLSFKQLSKVGDKTGTAAHAFACEMEAVITIIAQCHADGGCDARKIADRFNHLNRYFDLKESTCVLPAGVTLVDLLENRPDLVRLVSRGLEVIDPQANVSQQTRLRQALNLAFDVMERHLTAVAEAKKTASFKSYINRFKGHNPTQRYQSKLQYVNATQWQIADIPPSLLALQIMRTIADGAVTGDIRPVITGMSQMLDYVLWADPATGNKDQRNRKYRRVSRIMTASASFLSTYHNIESANPEAAQVRHDARKQSVEGVIDAFTDRTERRGERIFGFSGALRVGLISGGHAKLEGDDIAPTRPLSLPIGVAFQRTGPLLNPHRQNEKAPGDWTSVFFWPVEGPARLGSWLVSCLPDLGLQLELNIFDLGRFMQVDGDQGLGSVDWASAVSPNAVLGFTYGRGVSFSFGYTTGWDMSVSQETGSPFYHGLVVGVHVPLFDLN